MILSSRACKRGLPTIDSLLLHPFFSFAPSLVNGQSELMKNCHLKFPALTKEHLKAIAACVESRLKFDQKQVKLIKKSIKVVLQIYKLIIHAYHKLISSLGSSWPTAIANSRDFVLWRRSKKKETKISKSLTVYFIFPFPDALTESWQKFPLRKYATVFFKSI